MWLLLTEVIAQERQKDRERALAKEQLLRSIRPQTEKKSGLSRRLATAIGTQLVRLGTKLQGQEQFKSASFSIQDSNCS